MIETEVKIDIANKHIPDRSLILLGTYTSMKGEGLNVLNIYE
jgi:hypothetical protein